LVFANRNGGELAAGNVRRAFRAVARAAKLDAENWTPRELRHSFVSLLSERGVPIESIARLCGHRSTTTTERVYRHQLRPMMDEGAVTMDSIFPTGE
jgi:integrase